MVDLSVSASQRISPTSTVSPSFFFHSSITQDSTLLPCFGITTFSAISTPYDGAQAPNSYHVQKQSAVLCTNGASVGDHNFHTHIPDLPQGILRKSSICDNHIHIGNRQNLDETLASKFA